MSKSVNELAQLCKNPCEGGANLNEAEVNRHRRIAIWLYHWTNAVLSRIAPAIRPALTVKVFNKFGLGKVVTVRVNNALRLSVWLGDETSGKKKYGDRATEAIHSTNANAVMTASFHWWTGRGFIVLGLVICEGEGQNSLNQDLLLLRRCYFATTWDGKFLIGEANLTAGKLLRKMPKVRHLFGGG